MTIDVVQESRDERMLSDSTTVRSLRGTETAERGSFNTTSLMCLMAGISTAEFEEVVRCWMVKIPTEN